MTQQLQNIIDAAWESRANISPAAAPKEVADAVEHVIAELNNGTLRVATRQGVGQWTVHQWIKKAVLLSFRLKDNELVKAGDLGFYDKVQTKFAHLSEEEMKATGVRVVPPAVARRGSFIAKGAILMPSYVNIGAYVGEGTMAGPTIIEDNCFIGARSEVVEGVVIEEHSVLGMGVYIGQSTPIFNRATGEISYGRVPTGSVVVSGNLPKTAANGAPYSMYAAIIVKQVDAQTRSKTSINDLLRD